MPLTYQPGKCGINLTYVTSIPYGCTHNYTRDAPQRSSESLFLHSPIMIQSQLHATLTVEITFPFAYTGWRKKNACFSNNCNFVCFQYKKIMSTPKQPVINAVLITYITYSITENYIGKMASFLPYTRPEPLLKVLHHIY